MRKLLLGIFNRKMVSPWWILFIDLSIVLNAYFLAFIIRLNIFLPAYTAWEVALGGVWVVGIYMLSFLVTGSYRGVIRHSSYHEFKLLVIACFSAFVTLFIGSMINNYIDVNVLRIPKLVLIFHFLLSTIVCFWFRILVKETYTFLTRKRGSINAYIYGDGDMAMITLEAIQNDRYNKYNVIGIISDSASSKELTINMVPVISWSKAQKVGQLQAVEVVILAVDNINVEYKRNLSDTCIQLGWKLKVMPTVDNWVNGLSNTEQIRDVRIEDILGRKEIHLNQVKITQGLLNKVVLVTGAAGSIGSEIVRQLLNFPVRKIVLLDIAESVLYDLQQDLILKHTDVPFEVVLGDFTDSYKMEWVFRKYQPNIVYNAAAYKHVPLMERFPYEAVKVNVGGTKLIADLSVKYEVEKFVMISTDKAVNPTNVMGATKRICEIYIQSLASSNKNNKTAFITTRFGNVLGSNGSVVPLFKKQIAQGGPVTVTHPEITRYFMTIPEACQLVLEAGFIGSGGEIFVFDMGEPVKIVDLAKEMIRLAKAGDEDEIKIEFTGLRPGEKLYEELLAIKENTMPTHHDKIMIAKIRAYDYDIANQEIQELLNVLSKESISEIVKRLKLLVPEFKSTLF